MSNAQHLGTLQAKAVKKKVLGSSFYLAMRLMPAQERDAMFAIYAFCRKVDDIADDGLGTRLERHTRLQSWRNDLEKLYQGEVSQQVRFLADPVAHYHLRLQDFLAILEGMEMDVAEDIVAPDLATLDLYCERVASAVGRLSIKIFGMEEGPGFQLAHYLGRALQLTNILRDIDEDAEMGRLYLPREYLEAMNCCTSLDPKAVVARAEIDQVCRRLAELAHSHYGEADRILSAKPKGLLKTPRLMAAVYSEILRASEVAGFAPPRHRISLPKSKLIGLVLREGLFS